MPHNKIETKPFFERPYDRFINRELSWLAFNERVLEEANNTNNPLLERVKFLSISASNLDEFFMVRVAGLKEQVRNKIETRSFDGLTPEQQLDHIMSRTSHLTENQQHCWAQLKLELKKESIYVVSKNDLSRADKKWLEGYFFDNLFPALSPIAIDPAHPFPFLPNLGLAILVSLESNKIHKNLDAVIPLPGKLDRFINIRNEDTHFILLEDVVEIFKEIIFPKNEITGFGIIRITRDSDLEIEDEAEDLVSHFESAVKKRRRGSVIRLKVSPSTSSHLKNMIIKELNVSKSDISDRSIIPGLRDVYDLYNTPRSDLKFPKYSERFPERISDYGGDCFAAIAAKDIIIHHPYETFDVVASFLQQAARDPDVITIKQTLYRTSNNSPIVKALIEAAEAGKSVTVIVELKARFDEEANIRWARDLERAGAQVVFGFAELKTHAKVSLTVRREKSGLKSYVHFGTGNYHPVTAKVYSDLSFFTCNHDLCQDASHLFNYLTGYLAPKSFSKLIVSPINLRKKIIELINQEIEHAKNGKPANIWVKLNAITDPKIIDALYRASQSGVSIDLVIRGICGLRPGIKGFSDNIRVKTIVGRFLEHARIVCFGNGNQLPSKDAKVFISSADWMPRNFDGRVEVMVPIENETVHEQVIGQIMSANIKDKKQSWNLDSKGVYHREECTNNDFCAHEYFMTNPSLSGRGKALSKADLDQQKDKIYKVLKFDKKNKPKKD
ncbi:RNA degradosome polyphosphate kinase [Rickettsiales bacterium]|nr:RNA degradosome polyphosphate kinase [Rickettsiales bacterium]